MELRDYTCIKKLSTDLAFSQKQQFFSLDFLVNINSVRILKEPPKY